MRTDDAKELAMTQFLQGQGINHRYVFPYIPEQNSNVKRKHQHLLNVATSLMFHANLLIKLWGDCTATTTSIINITLPLF